MDPQLGFGSNPGCWVKGQVGKGTIGIHFHSVALALEVEPYDATPSISPSSSGANCAPLSGRVPLRRSAAIGCATPAWHKGVLPFPHVCGPGQHWSKMVETDVVGIQWEAPDPDRRMQMVRTPGIA